MFLPPIQRGTGRSRGPQTYWGPNGQTTVTPSSPGEAQSLRNQSRLFNPGYQFSNPQKFMDALNAYRSNPRQVVFGPEGPPGGPERAGYKQTGPQGATLPGQGPVQWQSNPLQWAQAAALRQKAGP